MNTSPENPESAATPPQKPLPLHCSCGADFYPLSRTPDTLTQCPHCQKQAKVGSFSVGEQKRFEDLFHPIGQEERLKEQVATQNRRKQLRLMTIFGLGMLLAVGISAWILIRGRVDSSSGTEVAAELTEEEAAVEVARKFLTVPPEAFPSGLVRDAARVEPLYHWYVKQPEALAGPFSIQAFSPGRFYEKDGRQLLAIRGVARERALEFLLEKKDGVWRVDWEAFSGVHGGRWQMFLNQDRELAGDQELCLHVECMPELLIMPSFREKHLAKAAPQTKVLRLFAAERERKVGVAVIPPTHPLAAVFNEVKAETLPIRFTLKVRMLDHLSYPPLVEPLVLVKTGWDQLDPPSDAAQ